MSVPKWEGSSHRFGGYRISVFWFRCLLGGGLLSLAWLSGPAAVSALKDRRARFLEEATAAPVRQAPIKSSKLKRALSRAPTIVQVLSFEEPQVEPISSSSSGLQQRLSRTKVDLSCDKEKIADTLAELRLHGRFSMVISRDARDVFDNEELEVSLRLKQISLANALSLVLAASNELCYSIRREIVCIETKASRKVSLLVDVYDLSWLRGSERYWSDKFIELLESQIEEEHEDGSLELTPDGVLFARKSAPAHRQIRRVIQLLRAALKPSPAPKMVWYGDGQGQEPAWARRSRAKLAETRVKLELPEAKLPDLARELRRQTGLSFVVAASVDVEELPLSLVLDGLSAKAALDIALDQAGLVYSLRNETVLIEPPEEQRARQPMSLAFYSIDDLCRPSSDNEGSCFVSAKKRAPGESEAEFNRPSAERLIEIIQSLTSEENWEDPASINTGFGMLIVKQTAAQQRAVLKVLEAYRRTRR